MNNLIFSTTLLRNKVRIYKFTREEYERNYIHFIRSENVMCQTFIDDEVTLYKYCKEDNDGKEDKTFSEICSTCDPRSYNVINIHEDIPGIDHIGIRKFFRCRPMFEQGFNPDKHG
jgi:hypothetical protein